MPFQIIRNDITKVHADAIVNTANPEPIYAAGTDAAIYHAAGEDALLAERKKIGAIAPGEVAVTSAFALQAKYILHTVGPVWVDGEHGEFEVLHNCYARSLVKAAELGCRSIAFPLIATGVYGFPKTEALAIAIQEISSFLMREDTDMTVKLVVFDEKAFILSQNIFFRVDSFIQDEEVRAAHMKEYQQENPYFNEELMRERTYRRNRDQDLLARYATRNLPTNARSDRFHATKKVPFNIDKIDETKFAKDPNEELSFMNQLMKFLIEKNLDNATVYKRANVSKGAFSKILCGDTKKPQKKTVLALCLGLHLNLEEAERLMACADMAFNPSSKRDALVIECLENQFYDVMKINSILFACGQTLLGF